MKQIEHLKDRWCPDCDKNVYNHLGEWCPECGQNTYPAENLPNTVCAEQSVQANEAICAPLIHALAGEESNGNCLFCGKPLRR